MLFFSRSATAAILAIPLVLCLAAVPNLLPKSAFDSLPAWAQNKITLDWELQGGTRIQLRVDEDDVRRKMLLALQDDVHRVLREGHIGLTRRPVIRNNAVEVRLHERDLQRGLAKLSEFAQPFDAAANIRNAPRIALPDIRSIPGQSFRASPSTFLTARPIPDLAMVSEDGLARLEPTEEWIKERVRHSRDASVDFVAHRLTNWGVQHFSIERRGPDRVLIEFPGEWDIPTKVRY